MSDLVDLVKKWEIFRQEYRNGTIEQFAVWILKQTQSTPGTIASAPEKQENFIRVDHQVFQRADESKQLAGQAGFLISRLSRFGALYSKPVMQKHGLNSIIDFGFLATIDYANSLGKKELCEHTLTEVTTGMDIIRRLKEIGYVKEAPNPADKREKLLSLTAKGKKVLTEIYQDFQSLPDVLVDMPLKDRKQIVSWMKKLDDYHTGYYKNQKA